MSYTDVNVKLRGFVDQQRLLRGQRLLLVNFAFAPTPAIATPAKVPILLDVP
jgi:hypothetical protein